MTRRLLGLPVAVTPDTGLAVRSFAMLDRITTVPRTKVGPVNGYLDEPMLLAVNRALAVFLGLA